MAQLTVRHIDFQFDDDIALQWNPGNPYWGNFVNYAAVIAPAFERYFIKATRAAMPRIRNTTVANDADLFCRQEATHSKHHLAHLKMLCNKHPELEEIRKAVQQSYNDLFERESLEFHLAYAAVIELCFGPFSRFVIDNREYLFKQADPRIASFILWHLVEEFEHRNAAIDIYNDVVGSYNYRLRTTPRVFHHMFTIDRIVRTGFKQYLPHTEGQPGPWESIRFIAQVPKREQARLLGELLGTLSPWHKPDDVREPPWVSQWLADHHAGMDMRRYYPAA